MKSAYPLEWPDGWPRTPPSDRKSIPFKVSFARARDELIEELRMLGASDVVISSEIPTKKDGLPYAGRTWRPGQDPGVVVYFRLNGRDKAIPCDTYPGPEANIRALGLAVKAMRSLDRYGISGLLDRAFHGLDALPAPERIDWRAELQLSEEGGPIATVDVEAAYRHLAKQRHPDKGGSAEAMSRLSKAREAALKEIGGRS